MTFKSKHSLFILVIFCIIGSAITTFILYHMLDLHLFIFIIIFSLLLYFLMKNVYFGNIRSITCKDKTIEINYEKAKKIHYKDIQAVWIKVDAPRRLNSKQRQRLINCILVLNNQKPIKIPYISFSNDLYEIIQYIHERNPNVLLDPISYMTKKDFYQLLNQIENCEIKPAPFIRNEFKK